MTKVPHSFGRRGFGESPATYAAVRPGYPDALYACLTDRCDLGIDSTTLEIGPGTGIATASLLARGTSRLHAIEPDARFAAHLRHAFPNRALTLDETPFENARLPAASFTLGVAATSFHWIDQRSGLRKIYAALAPGGWWAMWWTHFGRATTDNFQAATRHLFTIAAPPRIAAPGPRLPFDLDRTARLHDLTAAGFVDVRADAWQWTQRYDTTRLVGLYATFSAVTALPPAQRQIFLAGIARIADEQFGGTVDRRFTTSLYTGRRPPP
ncbi:MAG: class I SAM-dependent methyltransferase [Acidiphilium sp.]|nr:class I SAM-dependent methyltransferase [Acidiphilium sp.]MDD4936187.1 class I SAM-dependent methyltransferase [Acidiphilium sp.]